MNSNAEIAAIKHPNNAIINDQTIFRAVDAKIGEQLWFPFFVEFLNGKPVNTDSLN
jgi:hypothetical protein